MLAFRDPRCFRLWGLTLNLNQVLGSSTDVEFRVFKNWKQTPGPSEGQGTRFRFRVEDIELGICLSFQDCPGVRAFVRGLELKSFELT